MKNLLIANGLLFIFMISACNRAPSPSSRSSVDDAGTDGTLIIFHAGSVTRPVRVIADSFEKKHPRVKILHEICGSRECAKKVTELEKPCDILISSDIDVIESMLYPEYVEGWIGFATNEMVIAFTETSRYHRPIPEQNWPDILLKKDVNYGRSDPDSDPCGYRTLFTFQLAASYYHRPELAKILASKNQKYIRPKEMDLLALLQSGSLDYIFIYRSVALQHHLKFISLPPEINLSNPLLASEYAKAVVSVSGKKPGEKQLVYGSPMVYGITLIRNAPHKKLALLYLDEFLSPKEGLAVFEANGQPALDPLICYPLDSLSASQPCNGQFFR